MVWRPMLACDADLSKLRFPLIASPKLDGIRAAVVEGKLLTRRGKKVPNRHIFELLGKPIFDGLDGELIVGEPNAEDVYRKTYSGVMTATGEPAFTFRVFDRYTNGDRAFEARLEEARALILMDCQVLHTHWEVKTLNALEELEGEALERGYEGLMLRDPNAPYKPGRSTVDEGYMLKLKRFVDSEAVVLFVEEEMANHNAAQLDEVGYTKRSTAKSGLVGKGTMGALGVRDLKTGVEFKIGTGFTAADRLQKWKRGDIVRYKYFPIGVKDKPRHPVFIGRRDKRDM